MLGPFASLLIIATLVGGIALWVKRSRPEAGRSGSEPAAAHGADVSAGASSRPSLLTEAIGYVGTILVLAGTSTAVGQRWKDIPNGGRLAILAGVTVAFLGIGVLARSAQRAPLRRLTGVTWAVSVAGFAGSAGVLNEIGDTSSHTAFLTIATPSAAYAAVLWSMHRHAIQHAVMFAGVLIGTASVIADLVDRVESWMIAVPIWAIALAWAAAGWWRRIEPWFIAVPLGLLVALIAPAGIETSGARFGLGLFTAAAVMSASVASDFVPGLAMAAVALLGYLIGSVTYYFGDTLGIPITLTIAGLAVLVLAAAGTRWNSTRHGQSAQARRWPPRKLHTSAPH